MSIHLGRAQLLLQQERYELAEEQLRLALAEGDEPATAHALLALCLLHRKKLDEATVEARQAIHEAPNEALGFYALATIELKQHRLKQAQTTIGEAIRLEPWDPDHFSILASIEGQRYRWSESLAAAEQGLACDPDHVACNNLRAIALVNLGRKAEAGQSIDATLAKNPEDAVTHANQGWTLLHQRKPQKAMEHFREALRAEPNLEWARLGIIEAMKARFFLYRWLLTFFLWLSHFPPRVQLALTLGLVFGQSLLRTVLKAVPLLEPLAGPIAIAYLLFVWMTWTASSLFNLVLRLDPFGRLALNDSERLESTLVGVCLVLGLLVGASCLLFAPGLAGITLPTGLLYLGLMLPLVATFRRPPGQRKWFAAYTAGVIVCIAMTTWYAMSYCSQLSSLPPELQLTPERIAELRKAKDGQAVVLDDATKRAVVKNVELKHLDDAGTRWLQYSMWGIAISTWLSAGLTLSRQ